MRLFIAIRFSPFLIRRLREAVDSLGRQAASAHLTRPENLHLTLAFIGEADDIAPICRVMDAAAPRRPFGITVGGAGRFDDLWWAGLQDCPALTALACRLGQGLRQAGYAIEKRPFRPHITLARRVVAHRPIRLEIPFTEMTVNHISLMESRRVEGTTRYTEVYRRPFLPKGQGPAMKG